MTLTRTEAAELIAWMDAESGHVTPGEMSVAEVLEWADHPRVSDLRRARAALRPTEGEQK